MEGRFPSQWFEIRAPLLRPRSAPVRRRRLTVASDRPKTRLQRWQADGGSRSTAAAQARRPANALSPAERQHLLGVAHSPHQLWSWDITDLAPSKPAPRKAQEESQNTD